jgi:predicted RNase H-like HicB family nuclease
MAQLRDGSMAQLKINNVTAVFTEDEHGYYVHSPELPGCMSLGDSFEEAKANIGGGH